MLEPDPYWYKDAILYELHVKAFFDSNDDGVGDFAGLIQKLDYLHDLGVTALWVLPFYPSPLRDDGYDIADYHGVHPTYGTRKQFRQFVREAHDRGLRVITELVINHTSDQHPWFQAARQAPAGSSKRDFYVWSDSNTRYPGARIIFTDSETSNWTLDPVARAYYWHRFFHHQPDLNYDNPKVLRAVIKVMRFWFDMGVDGMRLDAIPYLIERDGTNCENLAESHDVIKQIRREMDRHYRDRMLLAEANQWPADVLPYFGDGDECNMAFHFPLMPRMFMALRQEDRHPIVEIMRQTPDIPSDCQWAIFLRNHDELTLEMVTDEERDYMVREYAADPQMRINLGIRRRLAPLVDNSRPRIELLNSLMFSMPGTPVIYYGDEIGMGDNIYLGDRNGVRTPMQWTGDRNAGFSRADFNRLYTPPVIDPVYGYQSINVEAQQREPSTLLNWMKRLIALRKRFKAFGRGSIEFLAPANRKILAYLRRFEDQSILCVANLSRFVQPVELDLREFQGQTPVELFGRVRFPTVGASPYVLSVAPNGFIWFQLEPASRSVFDVGKAPKWSASPVGHLADPPAAPTPTLALAGGWETLMEGKNRATLERKVLPRYMTSQRWFGSKSRSIETLSMRDWMQLFPAPRPVYLVSVRSYDSEGGNDVYAVPLAAAEGDEGEAIARDHPHAVIARVTLRGGSGVLFDATLDDRFCTRLLELIGTGGDLRTQVGRLRGVPTSAFAAVRGEGELGPIRRGSVEQSNTTIFFGDRILLKMYRRLTPGINSDFVIGSFLTEKTEFARVPKTAGALEYRKQRREPATLAIAQELVANQGQGWEWALGALDRYYDHVGALSKQPDGIEPSYRHVFDLGYLEPNDEVAELFGPTLRSAGVLGQRTAELHLALASDSSDPAFAPEPLSRADLDAVGERLRTQAPGVFRALGDQAESIEGEVRELIDLVLTAGPDLVERSAATPPWADDLVKIRCHGDYHLGQVLWTESDFVILDFEGEPGRSAAERRSKQSPLKDVAGMLRSFDYAASTALLNATGVGTEAIARLRPWQRVWRDWTSAAFLRAYRLATAPGGLLPADVGTARRLLDLFMLDKLIFELQYELNYRPDWVRIPLLGIARLVGGRDEAS
jgi:maltose alpha-D-glucosyltransferase/alpha-amylase